MVEITEAEEVVHPQEKEEGDNKMKKYFLNAAFIIVLTITLTGCYTVIWDPSENRFPTKDNSNYDEGYYASPYYGDYSGFYDYPWWFYITQPMTGVNDNQNLDPNGTVTRDSGSGRGSVTRNPWTGIITGTPSRNISTPSGNVSKSSTNSTTRSETSRSSGGSTNSRNGNGSRNSGNGRGR